MDSHPIEFRKICKSYRQGLRGKLVSAVTDLSFTVPKGAIYGFLGANGAGKTTTIKILMGLQSPTSGETFIFGGRASEHASRLRVGYLPERPYFHENLTAVEFLDFHRGLRPASGNKPKALDNRALLERVGIPGTEKKLLRSFSKGMLQRIGIAQALIGDPELIVLDEPMSGLDPVGRKDVRNLILDFASQGKTVFFSTHILEDAESICNRIAFLEKGVLKYEGSLEKLLADRSQDVEILFTGVPPETLRSIDPLKSAAPHGAAWKISARDQEGCRRTLEAIWVAKGSVISMAPHQKKLEEALFGGLKKGNP